MPAEFRFECKYCNKPIFVAYEMGGKQMACPHCKNRVAIPVKQTLQEEDSVPQKQAAPQGPAPMLKRMDTNKRPIQSRQSFSVGGIIKILLLAALIFGGYKGYLYWKQQSQKDLPTLMRDYEDGKLEETVSIKLKASEEHLDTLISYSTSSAAKVRQLVAECLGELGLSKSVTVLGKLLNDKEKAVRNAAAEGLGNIKDKQSIELLIQRLDIEKDENVRGTIGRALRSLTKEHGHRIQGDDWQRWWKENRTKFRFPN